MREILFRGKRMDNGSWVYGDLLHNFFKIGDTCISIEKMAGVLQVDPDTIGQHAGLKDKNGKRIFEGDIIRTHYANTIATDFVEQVVFHNGRFTSLYELHGPGNGKMFSNLPDGIPHLPQDKTPYMDWCYVIGNLHDNPELLKG